MPGSMSSLAFPNVIINSAVADSLESLRTGLNGAEDSNEDRNVYAGKRDHAEHKRIIFNGNGYEDEWIERS